MEIDFALKIADISGADPVITTATDVQGKMGIDSLARKYHLIMDKPHETKIINQALVDGKEVELAVPPQFDYLFKDKLIKNSYHRISSADKITVHFKATEIVLIPRKLVVGVGSRKGVSVDSVISAIKEALHDLGIPTERIDALATAEPKREEEGIQEASKKLELPLEIVSLDVLRNFKHSACSESSLVRETFGVPGICEPVALIVAGNHSQLIYRKKAFNKVTVALAVS